MNSVRQILVRNRNRIYARTLLRVYDALFLQLKPGAAATGPLRDRYEPAAYASMKEVIRETFTAFVKPNTSDDATENPTTEYEHALREFLEDEQRLADLAEFLTDLVREQSLDWLESWQAAERRRKLRSASHRPAPTQRSRCVSRSAI